MRGRFFFELENPNLEACVEKDREISNGWLFHLDASLLLWIQENLRVSWLTPFLNRLQNLEM